MRSLSATGLRLGVVTNGIDRVQRRRLDASGLKSYFHTIVTSERAGVTKPDPRIIEIALKRLHITAGEAIYIGDDPGVDGLAANRAAVRFTWFNPHGKPVPRKGAVRIDHEIAQLSEILKLVVR